LLGHLEPTGSSAQDRGVDEDAETTQLILEVLFDLRTMVSEIHTALLEDDDEEEEDS
jgi:hypothetical protein